MNGYAVALALVALLVAIVNACVLVRLEIDMRAMERDLRRWRRELEMILPCRHKGEMGAPDRNGTRWCHDCGDFVAGWRLRDGD